MFYLLSADKIVYQSESIGDIDSAVVFDQPSGETVVKSDRTDLTFSEAKKLKWHATVERQLSFD
tara:strand:+ start:597 stop:788 length:192 start_codon:yes stop_codon:yes gene_type:complete